MFESLYQPLYMIFCSRRVVIPIGTRVKQDRVFVSFYVIENGRMC